MQTSLITGFLSGLALIVAIGAQNSFVLRQGLRREHRFPIALICALSDAGLIVAGISGLGVLINSNSTLLAITRFGGAIFLLAYGLRAAKRAGQGEQLAIEENGAVPLLTAVVTCLGFTFLNPHVYLDTVVLLGALANQHGDSGRWFFGAGAALASFFWFFGLAYGAGLLTPFFRKRIAWRVLDSIIALVMVSLAISLLW